MRVRASAGIARVAVAGLVAATVAVPAQSSAAAGAGPTAVRAAGQAQHQSSRMQGWLHRRLVELRRVGGVGVVAEIRTPDGVWREAVGRSVRQPSTPAIPGAEFRAASVNKTLTSVLALQLVEHGRWSLDTTIGDVLPRMWPARSEITLRQLLSHRSGMPDHVAALVEGTTTVDEFVQAVSRRYTDRDLVRAAKTLPWKFEPGTDMAYSNTGYVVVGLMLKKATGLPMAQLLRKRVLSPAAMTRSRFSTSRQLLPPLLHEYARIGDLIRDLGSFHPSIFSSAGALVSTTGDLNRFHAALSEGQLVQPALVRAMRSAITPDVAQTGYGLGSFSLPNPCRPGQLVHGHNGATFGTLTMSFSSPTGHKRVTVAMTGRNLGAQAPDQPAMQDFVLDALARTCHTSAPRVPLLGQDTAVQPRLAG